METKKTPVDPPDTASGDDNRSTGTHSEASGHKRAESSESSEENHAEIDEIEYVERPAAPKAGIHPVQVRVLNDKNVSRFLSELLINLQKVDKSAAILPHPGALAHFAPLQRTKDIPNDESAEQFVFAYIAGLTLTAQGDTIGKVWLRSQAKFKNIKRDPWFSEWLDGSDTSPRVELKLSTLTGTKVFGAGFFLNVVTRYELIENFQDHIAHALESTVKETGEVPEFQIEIIRRQRGQIRLYKLVTSSAAKAEVLNSKMAKVMPSPSTDICYISYPVWSVLPASTQDAYYAMQQSFSDNHVAMRLRGVNNAYATIGKLNTAGTQAASTGEEKTVYTWLTSLHAVDGFTLFPKVLPCANGEIELWHNIIHAKEVKAWATTALTEIARLARIETLQNRKKAEELFEFPDKVHASIEKLKHEVSLPRARTAYLEFQPPVTSIAHQQQQSHSRYDRRNQRRPYYRNRRSSQFDFDLNAVSTKQVGHGSRKNTQSFTAGRNTGDTSTVTTTQEDSMSSEEACARKSAKKAIEIANTLLQRYPSTGKTAHQGMYDTIADKYGNPVPVVVVDGNWVVLTEKTLIQSRKHAKPRNFGIVAMSDTNARNQGHNKTRKSSDDSKGVTELQAETRKRWGDEESSEDEWAKNINASFQSMEISNDEGDRVTNADTQKSVQVNIEVSQLEESTPPCESQLHDTSIDASMEEVVNDPVATKAYFSVEQQTQATSKQGTYVNVAAKRLFNATKTRPETGVQPSSALPMAQEQEQRNEIAKLTALHNKTRSSTHEESSAEWQTVTDKKQKGRNKTTSRETTGGSNNNMPAPPAQSTSNPIGKTYLDNSKSLIARLEEQNEALAKRNDELAQMMEQNNRMLKEMSLHNSTLTAAMNELVQRSSGSEQVVTGSQKSQEPIESLVQVKTPDKKRASKKTSLTLIHERTPPKPPEGTPQRTKKKRVSESPASTQPTQNTNIYSPLQGETEDDASFDSANGHANELTPTEEPGCAFAVKNGTTAVEANNPHQEETSPGSGSNGVGRAE